MWVKDFPLLSEEKVGNGDAYSSARENGRVFLKDLETYLRSYSQFKPVGVDLAQSVCRYDFSRAQACLIPSIPGRHTGGELNKFGHMRLRQHLGRITGKKCRPANPFTSASKLLKGAASSRPSPSISKWPVVAQCSSLGSLKEEYVFQELSTSLSGQQSCGPFRFVWPNVEDVRMSIEGYSAGGSIPGSAKNMKPFLRNVLHSWDASFSGRQFVMPHIKVFICSNMIRVLYSA